MRLFRLALLAAISTLVIGTCARAQDLPEGQGKEVVQTACSQCHGLDVIIGQSRSREEWTEVVSQMIGNGAQLSDDDYIVVIEYLTTHLGPASKSAPTKGNSTSAAPGGEHGK